MEKIRILLVEDDEALAVVTKLQLEGAGYEVSISGNGHTTMELLSNNVYDVILLDVMLPDCSGHQLCERIRRISDVTIIFMSCLGDGNNVINAFREGGNDYLIKPVQLSELQQRIEQNLKSNPNKHLSVFKQFIVDYDLKTVYENNNGDKGNIIGLSNTEYKLLLAFIEKKDELMLYENLYRVVWEHGGVEDIRTLMVHVSNLRKKVDYCQRDSFRTVRGAGYIFTDL